MVRSKLVASDPEYTPKVLKVLELLVQAGEHSSESEIIRKHVLISSYKRLNIGKDYSIAAKKCLVGHRFVAAATLLDVICQQLSMDNIFFFKASSIVLENNPLTTEEDFFKFVCHVHALRKVNKHEIALEYLMHALKQKDLDGHRSLEVLTFGQRQKSRNFIIEPLFKAYMAMIHYLKWARSRKDFLEESSFESSNEAIKGFQEILEMPGQWDIFILKLIEMLEFYGRLNDIEEALTKYTIINPEHINSCIYLCVFLHKYHPSSEKLLNNLKVLSKQCPSDVRVLILVEMIKEHDIKKAVKHLFMFLDYPSNANNLNAWKMLSDLMLIVLQGPVSCHREYVDSMWKQRCDVWPHIQFSLHTLNLEDWTNAKVLLNKAVVLCILESSSHDFVNGVLEALEVSESFYKKLKRKITDIDNFKNFTVLPKSL